MTLIHIQSHSSTSSMCIQNSSTFNYIHLRSPTSTVVYPPLIHVQFAVNTWSTNMFCTSLALECAFKQPFILHSSQHTWLHGS